MTTIDINHNASRKRTDSLDHYIGARVREHRLQRGLSQQNLAETLGITYQQAHKYERGINRISASRLFQIAQVLDAQITDFFPTSADPSQAPTGSRQDLELAKNFGRLTNRDHREAVSRLVRALLPEQAA